MEEHEISQAVDELKTSVLSRVEALEKGTGERLDTITENLAHLEKVTNRPFFRASDGAEGERRPEMWLDTKSGQSLPVLEHGQSLAALEQRAGAMPSLGRVLRGIVLGGRAHDDRELDLERRDLGITPDPAGGYTVPSALSSQWIDLFRSKMVLSRAGARTIPMDTNTLTLARVTGDPTVTWHGENAALTAGDPTFGALTLTAKTITCLVKLSLELAQDSANIEQVLQSTITSAMSQKIDETGLVGETVNAGAAPDGVFNLSGRNTVTGIGAPTTWDYLIDGMYELMVDDVPAEQIGAFIAHPGVWKKMAKLKTGITSDNTSLVPPTEVAALPKRWTTAAPLTGGTATSGIVGKWDDLLFGVRKDITIRVLSEAFMGSHLQIAVVAYARVDFAATRHESFCTLEGITV